MADFNTAFEGLLGHEGGYVNNPKDPGGATRFGITERVARKAGYKGDMRELPLELAKDIAKRWYWDVCRCDELPQVIAFELFDITYNGGFAVKWLQSALGVVVDGKLGPKTIAAANACNVEKVVMRMNAYRLVYYTTCSGWPTFSRGWARRVAENLLKGAK